VKYSNLTLEQFNNKTLYGRVLFLDHSTLLEGLEFGVNDVETSIDAFFRREELANSVRLGERSYVEIVDEVAGYLARLEEGFRKEVLFDIPASMKSVELVGSLRNVGTDSFADPLRYTGSHRDNQRRDLDYILGIGAFFTTISFVVALDKGNDPISSSMIPFLGYGAIYMKMVRDSNRFLRDARKELPGIAQRSEDLVRRFEERDIRKLK